jgi:hypothetical protein
LKAERDADSGRAVSSRGWTVARDSETEKG